MSITPLFSVVVPVYAVQGYLRECLDAILGQSWTDLELIAVDDRSPDHCPEILDEYAHRDPRVVVVHLPRNVGLGRARNAGLDRARGDYVWFVDSDDWLAPGALAAVARKLRQCRPDVLLVDHTRVDWRGHHATSEGAALLARHDGPQCIDLPAEPGLLTLFTVAWNKVIRREFLVGTGIRFDVGWYEDLPFTFPILVAAQRIATLGRVCYHYRRRRHDAITQTNSKRHFEVFDQWSRVFDRLDALGSRADEFRTGVFDRMIWHLLVVHTVPGRLPHTARREFFHRMSAHYHRYRPPQAQPPDTWLDQMRHRLVAADAYHAFHGLRLARLATETGGEWATAAGRRARTAARWVRAGLGHAYYHVLRLAPLDPRLALFAAYWYRGYACNPAAIYERARTLVPHVRAVWVVNHANAATMPPDVSYVVAGTFAYYRALARARWLVNNVNFPDFVVKRRGSVHVQTHHGTPVKVMGLDQIGYPVGARGTDMAKLMRRCDRWDYSVSANPHTTRAWARAYPCRYKTLEVGYPRNDRLALAGPDEVAAVRRKLGLARDATVVLYAPTHREYLRGLPRLLEPADLAETLGEVLGRAAVLLVRAHYFYAEREHCEHGRVRDVSDYPCVEDLLLASDMLISDYSSVIFDYAVLDRPVVIYAPDWEAYRQTRGVTFDLLAEPPGVVATTPSDLMDAFRAGTVWDEAATKARTQFRARFCALEDGHAADRVIHRVFAGVRSP